MSEVQNFVKGTSSFEARLYGFDRYGLRSEAYSLPYPCGLHARLSNPSARIDAPSYVLSEVGWNAPYIIQRHPDAVSSINDVLKEHMGERIELKVRKTGEVLIFDNDYEVDAVGVSETCLEPSTRS
jgi:hypothetical protein